MKLYKISLLICFVILCGGVTVFAQPRRTNAQLASVISCFTEKEAAVSAISNSTPLSGNADTLRRLNQSLPVLKELIACADRGLNIKGLPLNARRSFQARRKEYKSAEEIFSLQSCIFGKLEESEKSILETTKKIDESKKADSLAGVSLVESSATQAKLCAEQGMASKTIPADMKSGFQENLARIASLLQKIEELKETIKKMSE